ncbi:MAG: hypothetical protein CFH01_01326, partial [Alphaproteobacteria bacterium MarineAlpha2_Bin1]
FTLLFFLYSRTIGLINWLKFDETAIFKDSALILCLKRTENKKIKVKKINLIVFKFKIFYSFSLHSLSPIVFSHTEFFIVSLVLESLLSSL